MKLKISTYTWDIYFIDFNKDYLLEEDDFIANNMQNGCGLTFPLTLNIYINYTLPSCLLFRTIMHELTHAYIWSYGFDKSSYTQEELCNFMETYNVDIYNNTCKIYDKVIKFLEKKEQKSKNKDKK